MTRSQTWALMAVVMALLSIAATSDFARALFMACAVLNVFMAASTRNP